MRREEEARRAEEIDRLRREGEVKLAEEVRRMRAEEEGAVSKMLEQKAAQAVQRAREEETATMAPFSKKSVVSASPSAPRMTCRVARCRLRMRSTAGPNNGFSGRKDMSSCE